MDGIPISEYRDRIRKCQKLVRSKRFDAILCIRRAVTLWAKESSLAKTFDTL